MAWMRRGFTRLLKVRRFPAVLAVALVALAVVPGGLAAAAAGASAGRVTHLPPELAKLHAKALQDKAAQQPGVTVRTGRQPSLGTQRPAAIQRPGVMRPASAYFSDLTATGGDQRMLVTWTPTSLMTPGETFDLQLSTWEAPYTVISSCTGPSTASRCSFTGLTNGHQYFATMYVCYSPNSCGNEGLTSATVARWPDPVSNLVVTGGSKSITATWNTPANNGGLAVDHYIVDLMESRFNGDWCYEVPTARADVNGNRVTFNPDTASAYDGVPVNGTGYTVTVFPDNGTLDGYNNGNSDCSPLAGIGQPVTSSTAYANLRAASQQGQPGQYTPVDPVALMSSAGTAVTAGTPVTEPVLGQGEVPAAGVSAVTLGVSVSGAAAGGSVYVWSSDASQPSDPVLVTNATGATGTVTVPVGASGTVTVSSAVSGTVHLDALGFYQDGSIGDPGSQYVGVPPQAVYNGADNSSVMQPISVGGIRPGAGAVVVSVTASGANASGSLTLASSLSTVPDVPVLYYAPGQASSAIATVPLASNSPLQLRLSAGTVSTVLVTVLGYYTGPDDPAGGDFSPSPQGPVAGGPIAAGGSMNLSWPAGAPAASSVLTEWLLVSYSASAAGTLSVYPAGTPGAAAQLSVSPGVSGQALIPVPRTAANGSAVIASSGASATVTADVVGYTLQGAIASAPTDVEATPLASGAFISWNPPCSAGAAPVSGYTITATSSPPWTDSHTMTVDGSASSAFMYGLTDTYTYTFTVAAVNSAGTGPAATSVAAVTPEPTAPEPPDQPGAQAGDGSALVSWMQPAVNGDSNITNYTITAQPGNLTETVDAYPSFIPSQSVTFTGLANGTAYTFTVTATNQIGDSNPSVASISVTPQAGQPIAPAIARARTVAAISAGASAAKPGACVPIAPKSHTAQPGGATVTSYQLGAHLIKVIKPPASFDPGTASLGTLHKYGYASHVKNKKALARWQPHAGHSHPVTGVPCVVAGTARPRGADATCYASASPLGQNGSTSPSGNWAGLVTTAPSYPAPNRNIHFMSTGNPFGEIQGEWYVGKFTVQPGGTNEESSWVGLGGVPGTTGLIQAGTAQVDSGSPFPWLELMGGIGGDTGMINPGGLGISPGDLMDVEITIFAPYKVFPQTTPIPPYDNSYATFTFIDTTNHRSETVEFDYIFQYYDGGSAEWIDEDVTRNSVCWHWNLFPYECSTLYKLQKFTSIHWSFAIAWGTYGNGGGPTNAGIWPLPPQTGTCGSSPTAPCWNNKKWAKSELYYPKSNSCEVSVGPILQINTDSENWFDTWHAITNPPTPCPVTSP